MAGNIQVTDLNLSKKLSASFQLAALHGGTTAPKFGAEMETMILQPTPQGYKPITYAQARHFLDALTTQHGFTVRRHAGGKPFVLDGPDGSVICFERYASVLERADKAYSGDLAGLGVFMASIEAHAQRLQHTADAHGLVINPYDFDPWCDAADFTGTEAPSERFAADGFMAHYDAHHPKIDMIDRRTTSTHVSIGYRDPVHLKRMMRILTVLTPSMYAAFSTVLPTVLAEQDGQKVLMKAADVKPGQAATPVPVPRALAWTLAAPDRSGLPAALVRTIMDPAKTLQDVIRVYCNRPVLRHSSMDYPKSFNRLAREGLPVGGKQQLLTLNDYTAHIGTLWLDHRADPVRLEARMAGTGLWKTKALACFMIAGFLNPGALDQLEAMVQQNGITADDVLKARHRVAFDGLQTIVNANGLTAAALFLQAVDIVATTLPAAETAHLDDLRAMLKTGLSDAGYLWHNDADPDLMKIPFAERRPLAVLKNG